MKTIAIIGAGVAGLSAGIYARKNGYEATVYESHYLPGGMCASWKRGGYCFDGSLSWMGLLGSSPGHSYYRLWKELGVLPAMKTVDRDILHAFRDEKGRTFHVYADADKLAREMLFLSPGDARRIERLRRDVKLHTGFLREAGANPFKRCADLARILLSLPRLKEYSSMTMGQYAGLYKDPLLRFAFENLFISPDFSSSAALFFLAGAQLKALGAPVGGSLAFARRLEEVFLEAGGRIEYRRKAKRVIAEGGRARGVEFEDGSAASADIVVSAADGRETLFQLLGDEHTPDILRSRYAERKTAMSFVQVSLGVDMDLSGIPHSLDAKTGPFEISGERRDSLWLFHYAYDPSMAPVGKSAITVLFPSDFAWWEKIGYGSEAYRAEKARILETTIERLEEILPGISSRIEASDVATPFTTARYTSSWKGALGFMPDAELSREAMASPRYSLPGLAGFFMIGQWVKGLGVPMAALSGKELVRLLCRAEGRKFEP